MTLFLLPGYELGTLLGALSAVAGVVLGIASARRALAPGPPARHGPGAGAVRAFARAALPPVAAQLFLFLAAASLALAGPCSASAAAGLFWLAALPSALLGAALGTACGFAVDGRLRAGGLALSAALGSLALTLERAWRGPSAAASDHLLGFWPGPIYDEALAVDGRLLLFRAGTLCWAAALLGAAVWLARRRAGLPGRGPGALALGAVLAALAARCAGGIEPSRGEVAAALGGLRAGSRCALRHPREWTPAQVERALRDCEAAAAEVAGRLAIDHPPVASVFVYRSPAEKRRLVGAGRTSFTKPWLAEIHVNDEPSPRPVLRHELVHALASAFASGPLRVPAGALVRVRAGLVEGLADALELPSGDYTAAEWARAMRDLGLLPPVEALAGDTSFLGLAPARAYVAAGSFMAFLLERHGPAAIQAFYRTGDPVAALGLGFPALAAEWSRALDAVAVPPDLAAAAELRFREKGLFGRACGREQAALLDDARTAARQGDLPGAEADLRRASALAGGDPAPLREAAELWRPRDPGRAAALAGEALARAEAAGGQRELRSALLAGLGDAALQGGDREGAAARYRQALDLAGGAAEVRALQARLAVLSDPALLAAAGPYLLGSGDPAVALSRLGGCAAPLCRYLLARASLARGAPRRAAALLAGLDASALPGDRLASEASRLAAEARCAAGDFAGGTAAWEGLARAARRAAERDRAADAARRCAFEQRQFGAAIAWPGDG